MPERGDSPDNPVTCHLPVGERAFLSSLRCPQGKAYRFERLGSVGGTCPDPDTHEGPHADPSRPGSIPVDHYNLTCGCGEHTREVFLDMYHPSAAKAAPPELPPVPAVPAGFEKLADDEADARVDELKVLLKRHLRPGESYLVARDEDGDVEVRPNGRSVMAATHPRFYGYLLAASQRISGSSGCGLFVFYTALGAAVCFALKNQALHGLADGYPQAVQLLDNMRTWWVYTPVLMGAFWLYWKHDDLNESRAYKRERDELAEHLARENLDPYEVLSELEGDDEVSTVAKWMKADNRLSQLSR